MQNVSCPFCPNKAADGIRGLPEQLCFAAARERLLDNGQPVPEPASAAMIGLAGLMMIARRRR